MKFTKVRKDSVCSRVFVNTPDNLSSKQYVIVFYPKNS